MEKYPSAIVKDPGPKKAPVHGQTPSNVAAPFLGKKTALKIQFSQLCEKNIFGEKKYQLYDKSKFLEFFFNEGLSIHSLSSITKIPPPTVEDCLDIARLKPELGSLLNNSTIRPIHAALLTRTYLGWEESNLKQLADAIFKKIVAIADKEKFTMKSLRFYIDFYWDEIKPVNIR